MNRINELIPELKVQPEYQTMIDFLCKSVKKNVLNIHSVYMCGSIPKGKAIPYESDADFTFVLKNTHEKSDIDEIEKIINDVSGKFDFLTKIDSPVITVKQVIENPYDWGFWIKIVSICLLGKDLSNEIEDLFLGHELQKTYYDAAVSLIPKNLNDYRETTEEAEKLRLQKKSIKGILRAIYSIYMNNEKRLYEDYESFIKVIEKNVVSERPLINELAKFYRESKSNEPEFVNLIEKSIVFYKNEYKKISSSE